MKLVNLPSLIISIALLTTTSCASRIKAHQEDCLILRDASSQSHTPGVYSNMRGNTEYRIVVQKTCDSEIVITEVLVKDVLLNVKSIQVDGKYITEELKVTGAHDSLVVYANQYEYSEDGPKIHPEEIYEPSGQDLGRNLALRYEYGGEIWQTGALEIKVLEPVLHN